MAFDSFGVKSMCLRIETKDSTVLIDPGIAAEVDSFPLPEYQRILLHDRYKRRIVDSAKESDVIVVTHYHYDHHICERDRSLYGNKLLLLKDPERFINKSQRVRAANFLETIQGLPKRIRVADGRRIKFGGAKISFSKALWHGVEGTSLGYVIMVKIEEGGEKLLYSSDVNGLTVKKSTDLIVAENPSHLILDGPPTYLLGYIMAYYNLARSVINVRRLLEETSIETIVFDHHLARDYRFPDLLYEAYRKASELNKTLCTAAELQGKKPVVLEGYRKNGPTRWRSWKKFEKKDAADVLRNAVRNRLVSREWLKMLERY